MYNDLKTNDERLLEKFDSLIHTKGYSNRSEARRDLISTKGVKHGKLMTTTTDKGLR